MNGMSGRGETVHWIYDNGEALCGTKPPKYKRWQYTFLRINCYKCLEILSSMKTEDERKLDMLHEIQDIQQEMAKARGEED